MSDIGRLSVLTANGWAAAGGSSLRPLDYAGGSFMLSLRSPLPFEINSIGVSNAASMFSGARNLVDAPMLETATFMVVDSILANCNSLRTVPPWDLSSVTSAVGMFTNSRAVQSVLFTGLRVSFSVKYCYMEWDALDEMFMRLGTAIGGATVTITNNPGAAFANRAIATSKGWTVIA